ncbi:hypothetical protein [Spirosoma radiotolerans]|uniref:hypothetical protein n=1 Tax=Spirosoma radiotolerans TaxID=1379870 RepID=UPI001D12E7CF|nr:hypothetical protein [Spirosoma radiotolerans]
MASIESSVRVYRLIKERFLSTLLSAEGARRLGGAGIRPALVFSTPRLALS